MGPRLDKMTEKESASAFAETYASLLANSLNKTEAIGGELEAAETTAEFETDSLSRQMRQVAKIIKLADTLKNERQIFVVNKGGWDMHNTIDLPSRFADVDNALRSFRQEMEAQGKWNDVVILSVSDFGRTITSNGQGTDHAWGGHMFVTGGSVKGGQVFGKYPNGLTEEDDLNIGRGRIIPTLAWEHPWHAIGQWLDVPDIDFMLPNAKNFPDLLTKEDVFK